MLIYFRDLAPGDAHYEVIQLFALRGFLGRESWEARAGQPVAAETAKHWISQAGVDTPKQYKPGKTTRGELLDLLSATMHEPPKRKTD
jgi:hypothetical protein